MFMLANTFCMGWNPEKADEYLGLPYPLEPAKNIYEVYTRGTLRELYSNINKDIEDALPYVSEDHYSVPKYHFNVKAAYAFATRFNLYYMNYDKCLDTLAKGDKGRITLEVELDGETQGNDYQNTLADLQMNFAVELSRQREPERTNTPTVTPQPSRTPGSTVTPTAPAATPTVQAVRRIQDIGTPTAMVQTGDDTTLDKYILESCISG